MKNKSDRATLVIVGMPLYEAKAPDADITSALNLADIVIAESPTLTKKRLDLFAPEFDGDLYLLKHKRTLDRDLRLALERARSSGLTVAMFSDCGLPSLFDPGAEVIALCRALDFQIRTIPGPASWAVACAASALAPPFLLFGFLPREKAQRLAALRALKPLRYHTVLLETPYRFEALIADCQTVFGHRQQAYLAWDIGLVSEWHTLSSLRELEHLWKARGSAKGEFILILEATDLIK